MKTAMQELIGKIATDRIGKSIVIIFEKEFRDGIELEKIQLEKAFRDGNKSIPNLSEQYYNQTYNQNKQPMKEIESNCLYCDINFIAIEHKSGECPNCKEKYEWDYDGDYGVDSVYGIQWLSTYPINKNK